MPILIITPDITAETWLGAAGCASGSQTCTGQKPALVPKPTSASTKQTVLPPSAAAPAMSAKAKLPAPRAKQAKSASRISTPMCEAMR